MTIKDQLNSDLKDTMRERNKEKLAILRLITAAIKQIEVDERIEVDDTRLLVILDKMIKQRKESITQFVKGNREDLAAQEQFEIEIISHYLPEPLSEQEINTLIDDAFSYTEASKLSDMGKVMEYLKPLLQGRADMAKVSALIKSKLG